MGTEIKTWQIVDGKLQPISTDLQAQGRTEPYDLEPWIESNPFILGPDIAVIGRQVRTKSGPMDLLGIDKTGNLVIIEIKRDKLPREALAQAIDYASDIAELSIDELEEICFGHSGKNLDELISESFPDVDIENLNINSTQRIVLVGFSIESALERMIEWLFYNYNVSINAVVLNYIKTSSGDELLAKTSIISEELEQEGVKKQKYKIPMSDDPGNYDNDNLKRLLITYLSTDKVTNQRIRNILLPLLLKQKTLSREQLKKALLEHEPDLDVSKVGFHLTIVSSQLGMKKNDFLRQVVAYGYPTYEWEKDNFSLQEEYKDLVSGVLRELKTEEGLNN